MALFQRLNRTDPERVFIIVQNNEGSAAVKDAVAQWEMTAASVDGVKVRQPDTGALYAFAGIWDAAVANGEYGLIQVYGFRSSSIVFQTNTSQDTGAPLIPVAGVDYLGTIVSSTTRIQPLLGVLMESITDATASGTVSRKIFIRAM